MTLSALVIEDVEEHRCAIASILQDLSFAVAEIGNGADAVDFLDRVAAPDLIVVDLVMPTMTGWEFIERMRRRKGYRDVPVIVISGSTPGPAVMRQIHKFIAKPFRIETLEETVIRLFSLDLPPKCEVIDLHPVQRQAS